MHPGEDRPSRGDSLECIIGDLNRTLRGWFGYFKHAHPRTFDDLDKFVRRRLRALLLQAGQAPGRGHQRRAIINAGQMPSSRMPDCSHFTQPGNQRDSPDEETTDWRAVCGKTARTVRREGSARADPYPYRRVYHL